MNPFVYSLFLGRQFVFSWAEKGGESACPSQLASTVSDATQASKTSKGGFAVTDAENAMFINDRMGRGWMGAAADGNYNTAAK